MLMLLSCKFCCLSYMTFLAAILDTVVQYLREVSVVAWTSERDYSLSDSSLKVIGKLVFFGRILEVHMEWFSMGGINATRKNWIHGYVCVLFLNCILIVCCNALSMHSIKKCLRNSTSYLDGFLLLSDVNFLFAN